MLHRAPATLLLLLGLICVVAALWGFYVVPQGQTPPAPVHAGVLVHGTVTGSTTACGTSRTNCDYVPTVRFTAGDGTTYTFSDATTNLEQPIPTGTQVVVSYDPANPSVARDVSPHSSSPWRVQLTLAAIVGLVGTCLALWGLRMWRRGSQA